MKIIVTVLIILTFNIQLFSQEIGGYPAKEYNKEVSLYRAKSFVMDEVIKVGESENSIQFTVDPLAAASSGELTTLIFDCKDKNIGGLVLVFYGLYWDSENTGKDFTGYGFKYLSHEKATKMFDKIKIEIDKNDAFLREDYDKNNICFNFEDMTILITKPLEIKIRVFWNGFDSEWEEAAFNRSKRRYERKSK